MINETLLTRNETHGNYEDVANATNALLIAMQYTKNWDELFPTQKEALHMIAVKIARILSGFAEEPDHWHDIAGYATLVENFVKRAGPGNTPLRPEQ